MKNSPSSITQAIDSINLSGTLTTSGRVNKYDGHFLECDGFPANLGSSQLLSLWMNALLWKL